MVYVCTCICVCVYKHRCSCVLLCTLPSIQQVGVCASGVIDVPPAEWLGSSRAQSGPAPSAPPAARHSRALGLPTEVHVCDMWHFGEASRAAHGVPCSRGDQQCFRWWPALGSGVRTVQSRAPATSQWTRVSKKSILALAGVFVTATQPGT